MHAVGQYITIEDEANGFQTALDENNEALVDGKYVESIEIFCIIARHSSKFVEFGDGDKSVRPNTEAEFKALREAIACDASVVVNKELAFTICDLLEQNPTYYLTPSY